MKALIQDMGYLIALRRLNRDLLAQEIGSTRQNLISAVKGRRPLPVAQILPLRRALGLDGHYLLVTDRVHGLTITAGTAQQEMLWAVLLRFCAGPVVLTAMLHGIGEGNHEGLAWLLTDTRGAMIALRNDDGLLVPAASQSATSAGAALAALFAGMDGLPEYEVPLVRFETLFTDGLDAADCRALLRPGARVWTWSRVQTRAGQLGLNAEQAAQRLGL